MTLCLVLLLAWNCRRSVDLLFGIWRLSSFTCGDCILARTTPCETIPAFLDQASALSCFRRVPPSSSDLIYLLSRCPSRLASLLIFHLQEIVSDSLCRPALFDKLNTTVLHLLSRSIRHEELHLRQPSLFL